jgi:superfamily II DNA or RNA helicase
LNFKDIHLKKAYSSDKDDILGDFYLPVLELSTSYDRLAGFFSSTSLSLSARGLLGLIRKGGVFRLVVSPRFSQEDLKVIIASLDYRNRNKFIEKVMIDELDKLENEFERDHIAALGWMLSNNKLEIKVALPKANAGEYLTAPEVETSGIFHQKVGILMDADENTITFSGSVNETAMGWLGNIEELKVFCSWNDGEKEYIEADLQKFNKFWANESDKMEVMMIPEAVKQHLIRLAPKDIDGLDLSKWNRRERPAVHLYDYQMTAIQQWINNGMRGIFEMATGTGKTFTALGCAQEVSSQPGINVLIITCPFQHLIQQWRRELDKFGIKHDRLFICDGTNPSWRNMLADSLVDASIGNLGRLIVLTTHRTFSSDDFLNIVKTNIRTTVPMLIADEVHGLGAERSQTGLIDEYQFRLGLSATPKRWFDSIGTERLYDYFEGTVFEFSLDEAIHSVNPATDQTYLTPYRYNPSFVSLSDDELLNYFEKTKAISRKMNQAKTDADINEYLQRLLFQRADVVKNASAKYTMLGRILDELGPDLKWTIIYCSSEQMDDVMLMVNQRGLVAHRFTMEEGTKQESRYGGISEREYLLEAFAEGMYQVLVAMKCLDEGVDVPPARTAILMSSSGNPREYIQRIGRIIRRYPDKKEATLFDIIVAPSSKAPSPELELIEKAIFRKELARYEEIACIALNSAEALSIIYGIRDRLEEAG